MPMMFGWALSACRRGWQDVGVYRVEDVVEQQRQVGVVGDGCVEVGDPVLAHAEDERGQGRHKVGSRLLRDVRVVDGAPRAQVRDARDYGGLPCNLVDDYLDGAAFLPVGQAEELAGATHDEYAVGAVV